MTEQKNIKLKRNFGRKIINAFIGIFGVIIFLVILSFGFMQTSTFRNWLKNKIILEVDQSINGTINISSIEGTILTSLYLNNLSITSGKDTIFVSEKTGLDLNTFQLLIGQIEVKNLLLINSKVALREVKKNKWNYEYLFKENENTDLNKENNSPEEGNPLGLIIKNLSIENLEFAKKTVEYQNSKNNYDTFNYNDIEIKEFNLKASFAANFNKPDFVLLVQSMSGKPNIKNFKLNNLRGLFELGSNFLNVENLNIVTDSSNVNISCRVDSVNPFSNFGLKQLNDSPTKISVSAQSLAFSDLKSFVESANIFGGKLNLDLKASGKFGDLIINEIKAKLPSTSIELSGKLQNMYSPENMMIEAKILNSSAKFEDVKSLLPSVELPDFYDFDISKLNATFKGRPENFNIIGSMVVDSAKVLFDNTLDLRDKPFKYDFRLAIVNFNAWPFIKSSTLLNGDIRIKGQGSTPADMNSDLQIRLQNSKFENDVIDSLSISANAVANLINLKISGDVNNSISSLNGTLDFSDKENPFYNFKGSLNNFNLELFTGNKNLSSNLNFNFFAKGKYLDIDKTIGEFNINLDSSIFKGQNIYGSSIKLTLEKNSNNRVINLFSNFADIYVNGNFMITDLMDLLSFQSNVLGRIISNKIDEFNPRAKNDYVVNINDSIPNVINKNINLEYNLNFKDYSLIQILLQNDQFNIMGAIQGSLQNDSSHFEFSSELNLDRFVKVKGKELMFLSGINADINLSRDNRVNSFDNIIGALTFTGQRLYVGEDIHNINLDLTFNDSLLFYDANAEFSEDLSASIGGELQLKRNDQKIIVDTLELNYKNVPWQNKGKITANVSGNSLNINNFNFQFGQSILNIYGSIADSTQDLNISLDNLPINILNYYLTGNSGDSLRSTLSFVSHIGGNTKEPVIDLNAKTSKILIGNYDVGSVICNLNYKNKTIYTDLKYLSMKESAPPLFNLTGNIPVNLTFNTIDNRAPNDRQIDLKLTSNNFDLMSFGNILPIISEQTAKLETDIYINGNINDPKVNGNIFIRDGKAKYRNNNLVYDFDGNISISDGLVALSEFRIANSENSRLNGKLSCSGIMTFKSTHLDSMSLNFDGDLAILGNATKDVNPVLYGDLVVKTDSLLSITYSSNKNRYLAEGDIKLEKADLTYTSPHSGFTSNARGLEYIYLIDSTKVDSRELDFIKLLKKLKSSGQSDIDKNFNDEFDYKIKVTTENDAVFTMNLAKELGQKIKSNLKGSITIDKINGVSNAQGSFQLLEGSKMEFFKSLSATGEIRFENNLLNPYLDITASYLGDYVASNDPFGNSQEVAVKIKLNGLLSKLGEKLSLNDENFAVYVGRKDIDSNIPNNNYDISDALVFILFGKFKNDLISNNSSGNNNTTSNSSAASYVISPILSSFLNSTLGGGVIEDIQISQSGQYYRVGISGKVQNLRYRIGGTTESLSDIAKANILVQYFINNDLSIRLERRYPIIYSEGTDERVNEFGVRYKFEF